MSKAALVTGSAKRVGRELALALAQDGYDIALHCNSSLADCEKVKSEIEALGQKADIFPIDLRETANIDGWFQTIVERFPELCLVVNNASIFKRINFADSSIDLYNNMLAINATAPIFITQAFQKYLGKGQVINLLDTDITKHHGSHFHYLLSKKMLADFTKMAAYNLGPDIKVNAICPGVVLPSDENPDGYEERLSQKLPLRALGNTQSITDALLYLARSEHVTGQFIYMDSGQHLL